MTARRRAWGCSATELSHEHGDVVEVEVEGIGVLATGSGNWAPAPERLPARRQAGADGAVRWTGGSLRPGSVGRCHLAAVGGTTRERAAGVLAASVVLDRIVHGRERRHAHAAHVSSGNSDTRKMSPSPTAR